MVHCAVQILNAASLMAETNARNYITTNYFSKTLSWIQLQLRQQAFFANMEYKFVRSWASLCAKQQQTTSPASGTCCLDTPAWFNHPHTSGNLLSTWW